MPLLKSHVQLGVGAAVGSIAHPPDHAPQVPVASCPINQPAAPVGGDVGGSGHSTVGEVVGELVCGGAASSTVT